ncbi:putative NPH3 domain-containing protein [Helianthus anomalus]
MLVGKLIDGYLSEIALDSNLKPVKFLELAFALPEQARVYDDGLYRAVDVYIKEEIATDVYTQGLVVVDRPTLLGFCTMVAGEGTWDHDKAKESMLMIHCTFITVNIVIIIIYLFPYFANTICR